MLVLNCLAALLAYALLLFFDQLLEPSSLLGGKHIHELLPGPLQNRFDELPGTVLVILNDFIDAFLLVGSEIQLMLGTAQKLQTHYPR